MSGILHGAYVLAAIHKKIARFQRDEVYSGTAEERAAKKLGDDANVLQSGPGHPIPELDVGENSVDSMNDEEKPPKQLENETETQTDSV
jgi:hypothetical protein